MNDVHPLEKRRFGQGLEPLPETRAAIDELEPAGEIEDLLLHLIEQGRQVRALVPDCVGVSLASFASGVTLTLVASDRDIAVLDAVQYLDDGPCIQAASEARVVAFEPEEPGDGADSEAQWRLFAEAVSAVGVRSTLTLPILGQDDVVGGSVNLYAASGRAFQGMEDDVAAIFSAWAPGAVRNADLSFTTRDTARRAPRILQEAARIDAAVGVLLTLLGIGEREARRRLRDASLRAGVDEVQVAEFFLRLIRSSGDSPADD
jgi:hypothetical protein